MVIEPGASPPSSHATSETPPPASPPPARWLAWVMMVAVMAVTCLVFLPTLGNGFVYWDDHLVLLQNYDYRGFDWDRIRWMFTTRLMCHFQPLTWLTYALDYTLWGMEPWGYHLTSLLFHVATAGTFFWVARHLLYRAMGPWGSGAGVALAVAAGLATLVFSIHPLRVESVAWATERRDVTSGLFMMIALAAYLRASSRPAPARYRWLAASLTAYGLSLMGKAMGMTLPLVLVALDAYPLRRLGPIGRDWFAQSNRGVWLEKLPYLAIAVAAAANAFLGQYHGGTMAAVDRFPLVARVAITFYGIAFYVYKTLLPVRLSPLYAAPYPFNPWAWYFPLSVVVVGGISVAVVLGARRWPGGLVLWLIYLIVISPVVGLVQIGPQIAADRYTYLACLGWAVLAGAGWTAAWQRRSASPQWRMAFVAASVAAPMTLMALGWLTRNQVHVWKDTETLWRQVLRVEPNNGKAHNSLANWFYRQGRAAEAVERHKIGIRCDPTRPGAYNDMAAALVRLGRTDEAMDAYRQSIEINPRRPEGYAGLGMLLIKSRDPAEVKEGLECLRTSLEIRPTLSLPRICLANHHVQTKQYSRAAAELREGLKLTPRDPMLAARAAWLLATCPDDAVRNGAEALTWARRAVDSADEPDPVILEGLAAALAETGQFDQAVQVARQATALARQQGRKHLAAGIDGRARLYASRRPYRMRR